MGRMAASRAVEPILMSATAPQAEFYLCVFFSLPLPRCPSARNGPSGAAGRLGIGRPAFDEVPCRPGGTGERLRLLEPSRSGTPAGGPIAPTTSTAARRSPLWSAAAR